MKIKAPQNRSDKTLRLEWLRRWSFVLSIGLHALLGGLLLVLDHTPHHSKPTRTEVELIDPAELLKALAADKKSEQLKGQIVEQNENAINDEVPEDSRFLSAKNQKIIRETQAANSGPFRNSAGKDGRKSEISTAETKTTTDDQPEKQSWTSSDGVPVKGPKPSLKDLMPSFRPQPPSLAQGQDGSEDQSSATDDRLQDVATGMQTLLSTREFVYYSYYNRIKDKLRQHWEPKIREKMERIVRQGRTIASDADRITKIVIILDDRGTLVGVQVIGPSGVSDLDEAAIEAFRAAAPFPNPPKGIIDNDGTIKIRWDFILEANAGGVTKALRLARIAD